MSQRMPSLLLVLLAVLHCVSAAPKFLEYVDGMQVGQGVNTFNGELKRQGAVQYPTSLQGANDVELKCSHQQVTSYEQLAKSLDISVAASFGYGSFSASAKGRFLDESKLDETTITYVVTCSSRKQADVKPGGIFEWDPDADNPAALYGDRFIAGFIEGGSLVARVSIVTKEASSKTEVSASAKVAFNAFASSGEVSAEAKLAIEKVTKNSMVTFDYVYIGNTDFDTAVLSNQALADGAGENEIMQLKRLTNMFLKNSKSHSWRSYAVLENYENLGSFHTKKHFKPLDYSRVERLAWGAFNSYARFRRILNTLSQLESKDLNGGEDKKGQLMDELNSIINTYSDWVDKLAADPAWTKAPEVTETPSSFLSKMDAARGLELTLCWDANYQRCKAWQVPLSQCQNLPNLGKPDSWHDEVTSIRLSNEDCTCTLFEHPACQGKALQYKRGGMDNLDTWGFNDKLSAVSCTCYAFRMASTAPHYRNESVKAIDPQDGHNSKQTEVVPISLPASHKHQDPTTVRSWGSIKSPLRETAPTFITTSLNAQPSSPPSDAEKAEYLDLLGRTEVEIRAGFFTAPNLAPRFQKLAATIDVSLSQEISSGQVQAQSFQLCAPENRNKVFTKYRNNTYPGYTIGVFASASVSSSAPTLASKSEITSGNFTILCVSGNAYSIVSFESEVASKPEPAPSSLVRLEGHVIAKCLTSGQCQHSACVGNECKPIIVGEASVTLSGPAQPGAEAQAGQVTVQTVNASASAGAVIEQEDGTCVA